MRSNPNIRLTFVGDLLCMPHQIMAAQRREDAFEVAFSKVKPLLQGANYVLGNLETPIAGKLAGYAKEEANFNAPDAFVTAVKNAGIDFVSTANNHCLDRGIEGLCRTLDMLDQVGLDHSGSYRAYEDREAIFIKEIEGVKIAVLACTYGTNSECGRYRLTKDTEWHVDILRPQPAKYTRRYSIWEKVLTTMGALVFPARIRYMIKQCLYMRREGHSYYVDYSCDTVNPAEIGIEAHTPYIRRMKEKIHRAKELADFVVVLPHLGGQYNPSPGLYQQYSMEWMSEAGADLIVANHAHTPLYFERNNQGVFVCYALGDFCTTPVRNGIGSLTLADYSVVLNVEIDATQKRMVGASYSIVKNVVDSEGISCVVPVQELERQLVTGSARERLSVDVSAVVRRFGETYARYEPAL